MEALDIYTNEAADQIVDDDSGVSNCIDEAGYLDSSGVSDDELEVANEPLADASDRVIHKGADTEEPERDGLSIIEDRDQSEFVPKEGDEDDVDSENEETLKYREVLDVFQRWRAENVETSGAEDNVKRAKYDDFELEIKDRISSSLMPKEDDGDGAQMQSIEATSSDNKNVDRCEADVINPANSDTDPSTEPEDVDVDYDSEEFREESVSRVHAVLVNQNEQLARVLESRDTNHLKNLLINGADEINRAALGLEEEDEVASGQEIAVHNLGSPTWHRPERAVELTDEIKTDLAARYCDGQIDSDRLAKGTYLADVLIHRNDNGNGRVARGQKLGIERAASNTPITEDDCREVLAIGRQVLTQTVEHNYTINFSPDMERLMMGACHYALYKGIGYDEIVDNLGLNRLLPEDSLRLLADRFGESVERMKEEYIRFMTVESDLSWWQD